MGGRAFDPYYEWLGIRPSEQPADFYRLLGIVRFEDNASVIQRAADRQMGFVRQFQNKYPDQVAQVLSELSLARITLTDREKKLLYDNSLKNGRTDPQPDVPKTVRQSPDRDWYVQVLGIPQGPYTIDELRMCVKAKEVREDTLVKKGRSGRWMLAKETRGLFDVPAYSPPPGTGVPQVAELKPVSDTSDLLSGPIPEPEDRTPGPNVWVCRKCRWPVPKPKTYCPRCGYVKRVSDGRFTERAAAIILILVAVAVIAVMLAMMVAR